MALTVGTPVIIKTGNKKETLTSVTFDSSYATGGETLAVSQLGLTYADSVLTFPAVGYTFAYDAANGKLMAYSTAATQAASGADLHTVTAQVLAIGV